MLQLLAQTVLQIIKFLCDYFGSLGGLEMKERPPPTTLNFCYQVLRLQMFATIPFTCAAGERTQGFMRTKQVLCQLSYIFSPFAVLLICIHFGTCMCAYMCEETRLISSVNSQALSILTCDTGALIDLDLIE